MGVERKLLPLIIIPVCLRCVCVFVCVLGNRELGWGNPQTLNPFIEKKFARKEVGKNVLDPNMKPVGKQRTGGE